MKPTSNDAREPGSLHRVVRLPFDESKEWVGELMSLTGLALLCWYDWRVGIGMFFLIGRIMRYVVLATRRHNR